MNQSSFVIAATSSGCGKTTFSLGLMRLLRDRGMKVGPFKVGPDYIDTQFHGVACGRSSVNLDTFMASENHVRTLFSRYGAGNDVNVVEGVMGMFDGFDRMRGSSADVACLLGLPVVLLVNAASTAYSVAATIHGFRSFRDDVGVVGVVFNRVASENHFSYLKAACEDAGAECLGYIGRSEGLQTPSRHLGLVLSARAELEGFIVRAAEAVGKNVDIERLLALTSRKSVEMPEEPAREISERLRIAVARDEAFNFIYEENLRSLAPHELVFFSPLRDSRLPKADIVYLPGGYPELYADRLEANESMRHSVAEYARSGGRVLAECGGMIYLTCDIDGHAMSGVLPMTTTMEGARLSLGYRIVELGDKKLRGHEFHYSRLTNPSALPSSSRQFNVRGVEVDTPLYRYKNTFAGYTHLYWGETGILNIWNL